MKVIWNHYAFSVYNRICKCMYEFLGSSSYTYIHMHAVKYTHRLTFIHTYIHILSSVITKLNLNLQKCSFITNSVRHLTLIGRMACHFFSYWVAFVFFTDNFFVLTPTYGLYLFFYAFCFLPSITPIKINNWLYSITTTISSGKTTTNYWNVALEFISEQPPGLMLLFWVK